MAKRGLSGQLNLFDFWGDTNPEDSIVEMVSLIPEEEPKEGEPEMQKKTVPKEEFPEAPIESRMAERGHRRHRLRSCIKKKRIRTEMFFLKFRI